MKYNQPYDQPSNPNAPYIDGNPSAGIQGSIVPAASIEYPQRELVAFFQAAGLAPSNSDLNQLLKSVKLADVHNVFKVAVNTGSPSQWSGSVPTLALNPPPPGTALWFKPAYASVKGGTVFSLNGNPFNPVRMVDLTEISIGDVAATAWLLLFFDGVQWLVVAGATRTAGVMPRLQHNANWYVNGTTGDDTNYDGTSASVGASGVGPFKTVQRAIDETARYDMNGYNQYVWVADGTYGPVSCGDTNGSGSVYVQGNVGSPQNCNITATANDTTAFEIQGTGHYIVSGFRLAAYGGGICYGLGLHQGKASIHDIRLGPCTSGGVLASFGTLLEIWDGNIFVDGNMSSVFCATRSATVQLTPYSNIHLYFMAPVTIPFFIVASFLGNTWIPISYIVNSIMFTGQSYYAGSNGIVSNPNATVYPGTTGFVDTGGQYLTPTV